MFSADAADIFCVKWHNAVQSIEGKQSGLTLPWFFSVVSVLCHVKVGKYCTGITQISRQARALN